MQPARECGPPCLQGRSVCDSTNSGWGGRQSFQKALNQLDYPVTLLFTCSLGFLHPRRGNETVGGRVPETGGGSQGSIASCGSTGVPHFFLHVMWVITFLLLLDNLTPPTSTHHAQLTSYRSSWLSTWVHLPHSSWAGGRGGRGEELFKNLYLMTSLSYLKLFSSYQNHHKPMVWLFPTTPAIEGLCCLCLSHAVPFPFAWLAPVLPLDLTLRVTSLDRPSQTNYHKYAYYLLLVPASFSSKHLSQVSWICVHLSYYLIHLLDCNVQ